MRPDPSHDDYIAKWASIYEGKNYNEGMAGYFLTKSHAWCENAFGPETHFARVLEVGAGTGIHIDHIRHGFDQYVMTDLNPPMLQSAQKRSLHGTGKGKVVAEVQDATALTYADESFDRVIAAHVLEHLPEPYKVVREWQRVLKKGGTLSLVLPCDPGVAWRLGRAVGARKKFIRAGIEYDYWMAREHVNAINNLAAFLDYYFPDAQPAQWKPFGIPSMDLNLFYIRHIRKD